jgi:hypothetical protein
MKHLTTITHIVLCEAAFDDAMQIAKNQILIENILHTLRDKLKTIMQNFRQAFVEQRDDFRGFGELVTKFLTRKPMTPEERDKLKRNFTDILKLSGVIITFPILGASGHMLLGWLSKRISADRFTTLPTRFASNLLTPKYTTDGIDTPSNPDM